LWPLAESFLNGAVERRSGRGPRIGTRNGGHVRRGSLLPYDERNSFMLRKLILGCAAALALGGASLAPATAAPVATGTVQTAQETRAIGGLIEQAQYYYGPRRRYYGPRRFYGPPRFYGPRYYAPRRYYGPPRFYGPRPFYGPRYW
jgi:hypothetical protein